MAKTYPYRILNPVYSNVASVKRETDNAELAKHPISHIAPQLRFSAAYTLDLSTRRPDLVTNKGKPTEARWGIARRWWNKATESVHTKHSIIGYGHRTQEEAQEACDLLNKRVAQQQKRRNQSA